MKEEVSKHKIKSEESFKYPDRKCSEILTNVQRVLSYLFHIDDFQIDTVLKGSSSVDLKVQCFTCQAIEQLLTLLNGNVFQAELVELRKSLEKETVGNVKFDLELNCSLSSLDDARQQLEKRKLLKGVSNECDSHPNMQTTWYCTIHNTFLCSICKDEPKHRSCFGLPIPQKSLNLRGKPRFYSVRMSRMSLKTPDHKICSIYGICMTPNGNILLADYNNKKLKKLDGSFKLKSYCSLQYKITVVSCFDDIRAVVCLEYDKIQFVSVSGDLTVEKVVPLDHLCYSLACHEDKLYIADTDTVYCYTRKGEHKRVLYHTKGMIPLNNVAVSDDGEIIYIASYCTNDLIAVDKLGNHITTLKIDSEGCPTNVCVVGDGTLLLGYRDLCCVLHIDFTGRRFLETVVTGIAPSSMCYDRKKARLIIGYEDNDNLSVCQLQHVNVS